MKSRKHWVCLAVLALLGLLFVLPPLPKTKAHAQRVQARNNLAQLELTLPGTNQVPTGAPASQR